MRRRPSGAASFVEGDTVRGGSGEREKRREEGGGGGRACGSGRAGRSLGRAIVLGALAFAGCRSAPPDDSAYLRRLNTVWLPVEEFLTPEVAAQVGIDRATLDRALEARVEAHGRIASALRESGTGPEALDRPRELLPRASSHELRVLLGIQTDPAIAEASVEGPLARFLATLGRIVVRSIVMLVAHDVVRGRDLEAFLGADDAAYARAAIRILADRPFLAGLPRDVVAEESVSPDPLYLAATGERPPEEGDPPEPFAAYVLWLAEGGEISAAELDRAEEADPGNGLWVVLRASESLADPRIGEVGPVRTHLREQWAARERSLVGTMAGFVAAYQLGTPHVVRIQLVARRLLDAIRGGDRSQAAPLSGALSRMREAAVLPQEWAAIRELEGDLADAEGRARDAAQAWLDAGAVRLLGPGDAITDSLKACAMAPDPAPALAWLRTDEWRDDVVRRAIAAVPDAGGPAREWADVRAAHFASPDSSTVLQDLAAFLRR